MEKRQRKTALREQDGEKAGTDVKKQNSEWFGVFVGFLTITILNAIQVVVLAVYLLSLP